MWFYYYNYCMVGVRVSVRSGTVSVCSWECCCFYFYCIEWKKLEIVGWCATRIWWNSVWPRMVRSKSVRKRERWRCKCVCVVCELRMLCERKTSTNMITWAPSKWTIEIVFNSFFFSSIYEIPWRLLLMTVNTRMLKGKSTLDMRFS